MFNNQALDALKSLKAEIRTAKNITKGTVRATPQKFGFVIDQEGQQHFIAPPVMETLLPEDELEFYLKANEKGEEQVVVEKLLKQGFKQFCGKVVMRGKHMFVEADANRFNRWFFVPPNARAKAQDGDLVLCNVIKHPTKLDGKSQAKISSVFGTNSDTAAILEYQCAKNNIATTWSEQLLQQASALKQVTSQPEHRKDLTQVPFVTIDSEQTKDMDDAIYVEDSATHFKVQVAIADPWSYLQHSPSLTNAICARGTSTYFPGATQHMMPEGLSQELFSLREGEERNAIVVSYDIDKNTAQATELKLELATIKSAKKMSYNEVQVTMDTQDPSNLDTMFACYELLAKQRRENSVILTDRPDYFFQFDDKRQLKTITRVDKTNAHKLVEEYMLCTNHLVALWLKENTAGLFISHEGFRSERSNDLEKLCKEYFPELETLPSTPQAFTEFMNDALFKEADIPLRSVITRWLAPAKISPTAEPHLGLGFDCYATMSSPIRKATDLLNHQIIHSILSDTSEDKTVSADIGSLNDLIMRSRTAVNGFEGALRSEFALRTLEDNSSHDAVIAQVNTAGLIVRLEDTGIEGFIDLRVKKGQENDYKFENWRLCATKAKDFFHVDQPISVTYDAKRSNATQLRFKLS